MGARKLVREDPAGVRRSEFLLRQYTTNKVMKTENKVMKTENRGLSRKQTLMGPDKSKK